jgi:nicotinamide riboside transporter PnuC
MITYMFMSLPAAVSACITWLKNPSKESKSEVMIASMTAKKCLLSVLFALTVTVIFHFLLRWFQTANLWLSTLSIFTSFLAASFLFLRSRYYALVYAANDVVLIGLWTFASIHSLSYLPMVVCFLAFLGNDMYGFINWKRMQDRQRRQNEQ